jgi:hypothetical protein
VGDLETKPCVILSEVWSAFALQTQPKDLRLLLYNAANEVSATAHVAFTPKIQNHLPAVRIQNRPPKPSQ